MSLEKLVSFLSGQTSQQIQLLTSAAVRFHQALAWNEHRADTHRFPHAALKIIHQKSKLESHQFKLSFFIDWLYCKRLIKSREQSGLWSSASVSFCLCLRLCWVHFDCVLIAAVFQQQWQFEVKVKLYQRALTRALLRFHKLRMHKWNWLI